MWLWGAVVVVMVVPCILLFLGLWLAMGDMSSREKSSCYECGFEPIRTARSSFSLRFFLLGVLFVVFDVEVVMMVPILFGVSVGGSAVSIICLILFIIVLVVGCLYERRDGSMDWIKEL
uniref:NADH-ubiquinone oxidoreductase chain 3 n=1 Tax=Modiolus kurilensis TaxID=1647520 RepID=A0A343DSA9_9BIVA|nr:NADH dehydrogenase subunit 3 [Modiolus kurilensis]ASB29945.1 NADH dehydrogenase subunit 3 [Modiolus kurilensis]